MRSAPGIFVDVLSRLDVDNNVFPVINPSRKRTGRKKISGIIFALIAAASRGKEFSCSATTCTKVSRVNRRWLLALQRRPLDHNLGFQQTDRRIRAAAAGMITLLPLLCMQQS